MNQFKRAQVIMLLTEVSNIYKDRLNKLWYWASPTLETSSAQHLYIISDDEIKEGDWRMMVDNTSCLYGQFERHLGNHECGDQWKKIIATTNTSLKYFINSNGNKSSHELTKSGYIEFLPQPSQQFIEKYIEYYNKNEIITDVLVEYEIYMQRQSNIGTTKYIVSKDNKSYDKLNFDRIPTLLGIKVNPKDNTITIKKLKDSWNREEMITNLKTMHINLYGADKYALEQVDNWIKENL